ncbi:MAG: dimethyl sulfoxide reductase anchor subunit [Acidobacteriota bacterium]|nr:dimethyl sulfoxide reductase anchor subunit [Acidobacteriota bacterium]
MRWKEWSLVAFTVLGQTAAGLALLLLAPLYILPELSEARGLQPARLGMDLMVLGLLAAAGLASLFHLKRPGRAARAVANAGSSWLSKEILTLVLFGAATAGLALLTWRAPKSLAAVTLAVLVIAEAGALVYSMVRLYTLPTVPDWNTPATAAAFLGTMILLGSMLAALAARDGNALIESAAGMRLADTLFKIGFAAAGIVFVTAFLYSPGLGRRFKRQGLQVYEPDLGLFPVWIVRIALSAAAFALWGMAAFRPAAPAWLAWAGFAAAALSEILGRALFYSLPAGL